MTLRIGGFTVCSQENNTLATIRESNRRWRHQWKVKELSAD